METYNYNFKLSEEEYLEYLRYIVSYTKGSKIRNLWLRFSIPLLVVLTIYYFRQYINIFNISLGVALSLVWFFFISSRIISNFLYKKVDKNFVQNFKVKDYKPVNLSINEEGIILNNKKIEYSLIHSIIMLKRSLAIFYDLDKAFIIPYATIGSKENVDEVVAHIEGKTKLISE